MAVTVDGHKCELAIGDGPTAQRPGLLGRYHLTESQCL